MSIAQQEFLQRFELGMNRFGTRFSHAIEGKDREAEQKVLIWLLRWAIADEDRQKEFSNRLEKITALGLPLLEFQAFGISAGNGYLITEYAGGVKLPLLEAAFDKKLELFRAAVSAVSRLHQNKMTLGDICEDTFLVRPQGQLSLLGVMGSFGGKSPKEAPPSTVYHYLAPEERQGMPISMQTDVYALGILGYKLFAGQYPTNRPPAETSDSRDDPLAPSAAPTMIKPELPIWIDSLIGKALEIRFDSRYQTAIEILIDLDKAIASGELLHAGRWSSRTLIIRGDTGGVISQSKKSETEEKRITDPVIDETPKAGTIKLPKYALFAIVGIVMAGVIVGVMRGKSSRPVEKPVVAYVESLPPELQPVVQVIIDSYSSETDKINALNQIAENDSPATYSVLASIARLEVARPIRFQAVDALTRKLKDTGFVRSGDVLKILAQTAFNQGQDPAAHPVFPYLLQACDLTLPLQTRRDSLHRGSVEDFNSALQIAAALGLDDQDKEHFVPVIRQLMSTEDGSKDLSTYGMASLISMNRSLIAIFERDMIGLLSTSSLSEISHILSNLAQVDHPSIYEVVSFALSKNTFPGMYSIPLKALQDSDRLATSKNVKVALVHMATGQFFSEDVTAVARWTSLEFEPVLLIVCALSTDRGIANEALEVLAGRSANSEPSMQLLKWVQGPTIWPNRKDLAYSIGAIGLHKLASDEQIGRAMEPLMPYAGSGTLFEMFVQVGDPRLIRMMIERVSPITSSDLLLALLRHADKSVRISAITALQGRNEVKVLQDLVRGYEREKDPEVRKVYELNHWVVKNR